MNLNKKILYRTTVPNNSFELELIRRQSFDEWKGLVNFPFNKAAKMGLYFKPNNTLYGFVFCIHCGVSIFNWKCMHIKIKHDDNSPYCTEGMNIPIRYKYLTQFILNAKFILYIRDTSNTADIIVDQDHSIEEWIDAYRICIEGMLDFYFIENTIYDIIGFYSEDTLTVDDLDFQDFNNIMNELEKIKSCGMLTPKTQENQI